VGVVAVGMIEVVVQPARFMAHRGQPHDEFRHSHQVAQLEKAFFALAAEGRLKFLPGLSRKLFG